MSREYVYLQLERGQTLSPVANDASTAPSWVRSAVLISALAMVAAMLSLPAPHLSSAALADAPVVVDADLAPALAETGSVTAIVRIEPGTERLVAEAVTTTGGEVTSTLSVIGSMVVEIDAAGLDALRALEGAVTSITLDRAATLHHTVTDDEAEAYTDGFYPETIAATQLWDDGIDGSGVGIAMVDTGIFDVPDLMHRVTHAVDFSGEGDGIDRFGHGTFTAGVIAGDGTASEGEYVGVAPGAHLISLKIAGATGETDVSRVLAAIQYAVIHKDDLGIDVLHLPIGTASVQSWTVDPLNYAVQQAWAAGIVVVVAAGNHGPNSGTITKPGDDPWVITVGATRSMGTAERDDDTVPAFSSRGPTVDGLAKPDVVAPGAHLVGLRAMHSTADQLSPGARVDDDGFYFRGSGTSFAAGVVSGAAALLVQANPDWSPDQIKGALLESAVPGPVGDPHVDGHGAIDVAAAAALVDPPPANQGLTFGSGTGDLDRTHAPSEAAATNASSNAAFVRRGNTTGQGETFDGSNFTGATWQGATWQDTQWAGATWQGATWQGATWQEFVQGATWQGATWQEFEWQGATWQGATWQGATWQGATWQGATWQGATWQGATWQGATWQ